MSPRAQARSAASKPCRHVDLCLTILGHAIYIQNTDKLSAQDHNGRQIIINVAAYVCTMLGSYYLGRTQKVSNG